MYVTHNQCKDILNIFILLPYHCPGCYILNVNPECNPRQYNDQNARDEHLNVQIMYKIKVTD